jgi:hypothetical protein
MTQDDRYLYEQVKGNYRRQNPMFRFFLHVPPLGPCWTAAACLSCCCENNSLANYDASKLDQSHRFQECVCFNIVMSFNMTLDPNYKHPGLRGGGVATANPVINIINNNNNSNDVKTGDVNLSHIGNSTNNASNSAGTTSSNGQNIPSNAFGISGGNTTGGNNGAAPGNSNTGTGYTTSDIKKMRVEKAIREERYSDAERILNS